MKSKVRRGFLLVAHVLVFVSHEGLSQLFAYFLSFNHSKMAEIIFCHFLGRRSRPEMTSSLDLLTAGTFSRLSIDT